MQNPCPNQWHLHDSFQHTEYDKRSSVSCDKAWQLLGNYGKKDVVVGLSDDGCKLSHKDFNGPKKFVGYAYFKNQNLIKNDDINADPDKMWDPGANHGTSCAGVIAAEADATLTVGAAPGCCLLPIKWESNGAQLFISDTKLHDALIFIEDKVDVFSNSWGGVPYTMWPQYVIKKIDDLSKTGGKRGKGIVFLWAAGNENCPIHHQTQIDVPYTNGIEKQGNNYYWVGPKTSRVFINKLVPVPGVLHIAALASTAKRSHYSNYGTGIDLSAPSSNSHEYWRMNVKGLGIITATGGTQSSQIGKITKDFGGTSSATPLVAGIAALVISANPELSALEVAEILKETASKDLNFAGYKKTPPAPYDQDTSWDVSPIPPFDSGDFDDANWSPWFGFGKVDAEKAVKEALSALDNYVEEDDDSSEVFLDKIETSEISFEDALDSLDSGNLSSQDSLLFPANGNSLDITITLKYQDGRPASGIRIDATSEPNTLTSSGWRTIDGLSRRWPSRSASKLRERYNQGLIRLGAKLNNSTIHTDANGQAKFTCQAWHVCGNESQPASDKITFHYGNKADQTIVKCGVNLNEIPHIPTAGLARKPGIEGIYALPDLVNLLKLIGEVWKKVEGKPQGMLDYIVITEASLKWGGLIPPHLTHRFGGTVDIRPISSNGAPTSVGASNYHRAGNQVLVNILRRSGATEIRFADNLDGVSKVDASHKNHLHVSWLRSPAEPWFTGTITPSSNDRIS